MLNSKVALIINSDEHINSTLGLCTPTVNLDDGGTHRGSRTQMWLWRSWKDCAEQARLDTQGYKRILVNNGDLGELDTLRRSIQLITLNKSTIQSMVLDTLEPMLSIADEVLIIRGTPAHVGKSAWLEEAIAKDLDNVIWYEKSPEVDEKGKKKGTASWWHFRGVADGVRTDIAHHANTSTNPFTKGYGAIRAATRMQRYYQQMKSPSPHVAIRSHNHHYEDSGSNYETFLFFTPAWTIFSEFFYRIGLENVIADIGSVVLLCDNGEYKIKRYTFEPREARQIWKLTM